MTDQANEQTVFSKEPAADVTIAAQPDTTIPTVTIPDSVQELVGDGKKYANVDAALAGIPHAQAHISTVESENARLRDEIAKANAREDVLKEMQAAQQPSQDQTQAPVDANAIVTQVLNSIKVQDDAQVTASNIAAADAAAKLLYGDKMAGEITVNAAKNLGLSLAAMEKLAGESPAAFAKLLADNKNEVSDIPLHVPTSATPQAITDLHSPAASLQKPRKSVLMGASTAEVVDEWRRCKQLAENDMNS